MVITRTSALARPMLVPAEEQALIAEFQKTQSDVALRRITEAYLRLCFSTAANYSENDADIEELAQEATFGIRRAIMKFDPERGVKFSTYIRRWLQTFISAAASRTMSDVAIPARAFIDAKMGRIPEGKNDPARNAVLPTTRLDAPISNDEGNESVGARLRDIAPTPEETAIALSVQREASRQVAFALDALTEREQRIISRRRLTEYPETLEEIARDLNITRERVRQIEAQAMQKMLVALKQAGFNGEVFG